MVFYKNGAPNITVHRLSTLDSVIMFNSRIEYLATTYNEIKDKRSSIDSMGFKPVMYSNKHQRDLGSFHQRTITQSFV
jgi:hypothetical protein